MTTSGSAVMGMGEQLTLNGEKEKEEERKRRRGGRRRRSMLQNIT